VVVVDAVSVGDAGVRKMDGMGDIELEARACTSIADDDCDGSCPSEMISFTSSLGLRSFRGSPPNVVSQGSSSLNGVRLAWLPPCRW